MGRDGLVSSLEGFTIPLVVRKFPDVEYWASLNRSRDEKYCRLKEKLVQLRWDLHAPPTPRMYGNDHLIPIWVLGMFGRILVTDLALDSRRKVFPIIIDVIGFEGRECLVAKFRHLEWPAFVRRVVCCADMNLDGCQWIQ